MSYWNSDTQKIESFPDENLDGHSGWIKRDCGCCNGICWSAGYEAIECSDCGGGGFYCLHKASGIHALYPGGPITGRSKPAPETETETNNSGQ